MPSESEMKEEEPYKEAFQCISSSTDMISTWNTVMGEVLSQDQCDVLILFFGRTLLLLA